MNQVLLIVAQDRPDLWKYWTWWLSELPNAQVILDRWQEERRQRVEMHEPEIGFAQVPFPTGRRATQDLFS